MTKTTIPTTNVTVELEGFDEFINKLNRLSSGAFVNSPFQKFCEHARQLVIDGTPVGDDTDEHPGLMKRSWEHPIYSVGGRNIKATITNTVDYGMASNYGHYQHVGMYVPAINARLVHYYVPGTYALESSLLEAELDFESVIKPEVLAIWNDEFISEDYRGVTYNTVRQSYYDKPNEEHQ